MPETTQTPLPLAGLMGEIRDAIAAELHTRLHAEGFGEIRPSHGCVFRGIEPEGSRLTQLAERSGFTKQAVGEVVTDLERLGYVDRRPDPEDGRAKIIHLTSRGEEGMGAASRIFADIESELAEQVGKERMAELRETLEQLYWFMRERRS
jgi:DNA-binding MarR family transcriptional regulator